jgi:hypothetical protein
VAATSPAATTDKWQAAQYEPLAFSCVTHGRSRGRFLFPPRGEGVTSDPEKLPAKLPASSEFSLNRRLARAIAIALSSAFNEAARGGVRMRDRGGTP